MKRAIWTAVILALGVTGAGGAGTGNPTPEELAAFFDTAVPALMRELHIAGTVAGVTDRTRVLFLGGYGSGDLEAGTPVDPQETLFLAGSISKLFTWTAVMQLEEQGRLRLEDPVEKHLDFRLPATFEEPIRMIDLMNHTAGFEDRLIGLMVQNPKHRISLRQAVSRHIPRRVRPPGKQVSYSNYGTMLAGYVVERLSGMPYEQYVARNILEPLGMSRSSFLQPPPPELARSLSKAYAHGAGEYAAQELEFVNGAPCGALSTTAPDMLRFYRAYLNDGELDGRRILQEQTVRRMQQATFRQDPRAAGFAHGFFEIQRGGLRGFGHGGDTMYFHSDSGYLPDQGLAWFVSTNSAAGMQLTLKLMEQMADRFFPSPTGAELAARAGPVPAGAEQLREYTGFFSMNRRSESDPTQIIGGISLIRPKLSADGTRLWMASILDPKGSLYLPVDRDIFQQEDGTLRVVFLRDERGRVRSLLSSDFPAFLFTRPPWFEAPALSLAVVALALLLILGAAFAPPTGLLCLIPRLRSKAAGATRLLALWSARAYLLLLLGQVILVASLGNIIFVPIGVAHALPLYLAAAAVAVVLASLVPVWRQGLFRRFGRIHYTVFAVSQALFLIWLGHWGFFFV